MMKRLLQPVLRSFTAKGERFARETAVCIGLAARLPVLKPEIQCVGSVGCEIRPRLSRIGQRGS